jgi:hypothetical protein
MIDYFDDSLLEEFIHTFYGYGNYAGRYWFVGMEEGGGGSYEEINRRLTLWEARGKRELEDAAEYHIQLDMAEYFQPPGKRQATWAGLIRLLLNIKQVPADTTSIRAYQIDQLGRSSAETCLVELLPLPSPSIGNWLYGRTSTVPYLKSRETYTRWVAPKRVEQLRRRIKAHRPPVVIFYGTGYRSWWEEIAEVEFDESTKGLLLAHSANTVYGLIKHPAAFGITKVFYQQAGTLITALIQRSA